LKDQLKPLFEIYKNDPVSLVWVDKYQESPLHQQFDSGKYHLVAYKPKRGRFVGYKNADFSTQTIRGWMDDVIGGGGEFLKFEDTELKLGGKREDL
jgi:hypothetical protein